MKKRKYTLGEEIFNAVSHGAGVIVSIAALVLMIVFATFSPTPLFGYRMASSIIFGISLIILYLNSTLYHAFTGVRVKKLFQVLDHCSIYILIAGTYTPFALVTLNGSFGWTVLGVVWGIAIVGVLLDSLRVKRPKWVSTLMYLGMGWMVVFIIIFAREQFLANLGINGLIFLGIGGLFYTLGTIFYSLRIKYMHSIWHLFVLGGSIFHFFAIFLYVIK